MKVWSGLKSLNLCVWLKTILTLFYTSIGHKRPQNRDVYKYVVPDYAYKWRYLGAQLGFKQPILNSIFEDFRNDSNRCCKELLDQWLEKNANASWAQLLLAIDNLPTFPEFFYPGT